MYVFTGQVLCKDQPCGSSRVVVTVTQSTGDGPSEEVTPDENGFYQVEFSLPGTPDQSAQWTVFASAPKPDETREEEARGRLIMTDTGAPVTIARTFRL
jgi:hypothetical protein